MRNSTIVALTKMIVGNALDEKPCKGLLVAYAEEFESLCELEGADYATQMQIVEASHECDRIMSDEFVRQYKLLLDHDVSVETCLEVFMYPNDFPDTKVPRRVLLAVGRAMARRDARMANELRRAVVARS